MNPDEDGQYTLTFDDVSYTIGDTDTHYEGFTTTDTGMDLGVDSFYKGLEDEVEKIELDEVNSRLQRIERVLGIPAELDRNVEMEEKTLKLNIDIIQEMVIDNLKIILEENSYDQNIELKPETEIFGETAIIDSLGLVDLIVALEEHLMDEYDQDIIVVDESSIIDTDSPFKSIRSLSNLILLKIDQW